jgi:hypothetical protein
MSLVYYNPLGFYRDFHNLDQHKKIQSLFNPAISIYDRTGTIDCPLNIVNQYPLITGEFSTDFETLCHNRIQEILAGYHEIGILYSGGIDSTLVSALLFQHIKPEDADRITFFYNEASILENRPFFDRYIDGRFKSGNSWDFDDWLAEPNRVMVTGECADNLFGSLSLKSIINRFNDPDMAHRPYQPIVELLWRDKLGSDFDSVYERFIQLAERCPFPITTVNDWFWWLNFTMKWQAVIYRIYSHTDLSKTKNKLIHFFNTEQFQLWSLNNHDLKIKQDWKSYKWLMKDLIHKFDGDSNYRDNKVKFPSLPSMVRFKQVTDYISEDFASLRRSEVESLIIR